MLLRQLASERMTRNNRKSVQDFKDVVLKYMKNNNNPLFAQGNFFVYL